MGRQLALDDQVLCKSEPREAVQLAGEAQTGAKAKTGRNWAKAATGRQAGRQEVSNSRCQRATKRVEPCAFHWALREGDGSGGRGLTSWPCLVAKSSNN